MKNLKYYIILICLAFIYSESRSQWSQALSTPGMFVRSIVKCQGKLFAGTSVGILNIGQIYSSSNNGLNWSLVNTGYSISGVFSIAVRGNSIFVGTYESGLLKSYDAGQTWTLDDAGIQFLGVFGVAVPGDSNVFLYVNQGTGYKLSTNNGQTFTNLSLGTQFPLLQTYEYLPGKFLAGGRKGVALSENSGANWSTLPNAGLPANPDGTSPIRALYYYNNKLFAGCIDRIYTSTDFGNTFSPTNFLLSNFEYFSSMVSAGNKLFASLTIASNSTNPSLIMTTNDGVNWVNYQTDGFPGNGVYSMVVSDDYLVAGTSQSGIWIRPLDKADLHLQMSFEGFYLQDTITVELRNSVSPFNLIESKKGLGGQGISGLFRYINAVNGTPYYITVRHRNSVTTWSSAPVQFSNNNLVYDFTSSQSQALGSNMVFANNEWSIYTGDVNHDGLVDLKDGNLIYNDILNFTLGYVNTDLNYDDITDLGDLVLQINNSNKFISEIQP